MYIIKQVFIAEKPSVAREFAKVLEVSGSNQNGYIESDKYIFTWCIGHLITMSYPEKYDEKLKYWNFSTLPFIPNEFKYEIIEAVSKQFEIVRNILNREDVETIYVCTDSGREGEYIYRLVDSMAGNPDKDKKRVWIDSQTKEEILKGIKEAKPLSEYNSLSDSAYLRAKEDYLIGINFSRLLTLAYGKEVQRRLGDEKGAISIGRVMTCVLGMIVKREKEIREFKKLKYYKVNAGFKENLDKDTEFLAEWKVCEKSKYYNSPYIYNENGFKNEKHANELLTNLTNSKNQAKVIEVIKKNQKENAPLLYNLAELQNECSKKFKISPDETLKIAQELYEKKLITYPRTDARVLSKAVCKEIRVNLNGLSKSSLDESIKVFLDKMIKEKYSINIENTKYVNDKKITDHYAIIPTGKGFESYERLNILSKEVYHIIVKRFISIFFPPAEYSKVSVKVNIDNEEFNATGKVCKKQGYLEVIKIEKGIKIEEANITDVSKELAEDESVKEENLQLLGSLKKGQELIFNKGSVKEAETSPPARYSSGSIILAMENAGRLIEDEELREQIKGSGIGTSATRSEIIKKLENIDYISSNKKTQILTPTKRGEVIYDITLKTLPDMLNPELTASWEKGLSMVSQKEINQEEFFLKLEKYIRDKVVRFKEARNTYLHGI